MIAILDYGIGNLLSVKNMLRKAGVTDVLIVASADEVRRADKLVLPGVGHFGNGMKKLRASGMFDALNERVTVDKTPVIGICLGAQMLTRGSEEGKEEGLGWIDAHCERFDPQKMSEPLAVPHMGWAEVVACKESRLLRDLPGHPRFYFTHSYHIVCNDPMDRLLAATYGIDFTAAVERGNIVGTQFHPEKSHKFGMRLLANFAQA
ncbi:MAG: imidazole glycerol phosphate synthase subunit HisH [Fimbriimonadaceae bacterium]|nr:imidazole glycerol phosphate synthase subunit HisH [Fimbriimonadaceae bacterium]